LFFSNTSEGPANFMQMTDFAALLTL